LSCSFTLSLHDALPIFFVLRVGSEQLACHGFPALFLHAAGSGIHPQQSPLLIVVVFFGRTNPGKQQTAREREPLGVHTLVPFLQDRKSTRLNSSHRTIS